VPTQYYYVVLLTSIAKVFKTTLSWDFWSLDGDSALLGSSWVDHVLNNNSVLVWHPVSVLIVRYFHFMSSLATWVLIGIDNFSLDKCTCMDINSCPHLLSDIFLVFLSLSWAVVVQCQCHPSVVLMSTCTNPLSILTSKIGLYDIGRWTGISCIVMAACSPLSLITVPQIDRLEHAFMGGMAFTWVVVDTVTFISLWHSSWPGHPPATCRWPYQSQCMPSLSSDVFWLLFQFLYHFIVLYHRP